MTLLNFPSSPALNDEYLFGTRTWVFNGVGWALKAVASLGDTDNVPEGTTNKYFTDARAKSAVAGEGYLKTITSTQVTSALGFTPYDAANPDGFIDASALTPFLASAAAVTTYQPIDADLTAIAALTGTTGLLKKTAANTWALDTTSYEVTTNKNAVNGYAGLDASGLIPSSLLPSFVDDVIEAANFAALPATGTSGKIYVALDTGKTFRWSGSAYVEISASPGSTDSVTEGSVNLYFTTARARGAVSATGSISYNATTGVFSYTTPTTDGVTEGSASLYFTQARARAAISATQNISYNPTTGVITGPDLSGFLPKSGGAVSGTLLVGTSTDNGVDKLQVNGPIKSLSGGFKFPDGSVQTTAANSGASASSAFAISFILA